MTTRVDWLKQLPSAFLRKDAVPLFGFPPPFPWEQFVEKLQALFELDRLTIQPVSAVELRSASELFAGMSDRLMPLNIVVTPSAGKLCWVMAEDDVATLMSLLLTHRTHPQPIIDVDFKRGFYTFLGMEAIHLLSQLDFDKSLSAHILDDESLPNEDVWTLDISITVQEKTMWGRLVISSALQQSWKERYAERRMDIPLPSSLTVITHLEAGRVALAPSVWEKVSPGDFIALDHCTVDPSGTGLVRLTLDNKTAAWAKWEEGHIELVEHNDHEVEEIMANNHPEEEELDASHEEESRSDEEEEEELDRIEEEEGMEELLEEKPPKEEEWPPLPESRAAHVVEPEPAPEEAPLSLKEVPLPVVVEIGRLQLSLQKLIELQPGNVLPLNVRPEDGVDLLVNGRRIAKGELLRVGDVLGVRILDKA